MSHNPADRVQDLQNFGEFGELKDSPKFYSTNFYFQKVIIMAK